MEELNITVLMTHKNDLRKFNERRTKPHIYIRCGKPTLTAVGSNLSVSYTYDGNDKRVKSFNALTNQTTVFVYDADGSLAAEYTINVPPPSNGFCSDD